MRKVLIVLSLIFISPLAFSLEGAKLMALSPVVDGASNDGVLNSTFLSDIGNAN